MIEISNLTKKYDDKIVVNNLCLQIKANTVFGFLGANGAGKTTTMKMLVGLAWPDSGTIKIDGNSPTESSVRESIGFMPESPYFYDHLTGLEFMQYCSQLFSKHKNKKQLLAILDKVGIAFAADRMVDTYSKGMKQRLGFAQAMVNDAKYIFLDEPLDGLDPIGRREIKLIIQNLHKGGCTVFFNSHILSDVQEICSHIGIIHEGRLLYNGDVATFAGQESLEERFVKLIEEQKKNG